MKPFVSHLIAVYQQDRFVEETVLSALKQDYDRLQVVVAEDGSTDETLPKLRELESAWGDRLRVVTGKNLGVTGNSNRGLSACTGELVSLQGGDDVLLPGKIAAQVEWFDAHPDGVLCGHPVEHFFTDAPDTLEFQPRVAHPVLNDGFGPEPFVERSPLYAGTSVMLRRSAMPKGGFDARLALLSDWKLYVDTLADGGRFGAVPQVLARYRLHRNNVTHRRAAEMDKERFLTLSLIEGERPRLARACRRGRARLLYERALREWAAGNDDAASRDFFASFRLQPIERYRSGLFAVAARLPADLQRALRMARARLRGAA
jgi:glycosyltransferase involved in cell wall biosynthesis